MSEPHWMAYVGLATGIIGAITGIAGAVMGWIAYRRSDQIKALDLRLELRKAINTIEQAIGEATELLTEARRSRERITAAIGASGAMQVWQEQYQKDQVAVRELTGRAPKADKLVDLKPEELEVQLAAVHHFQIELAAIVSRYNASIEEDNQHRAGQRQAMFNRPPIERA
jgi:hypothetical protein